MNAPTMIIVTVVPNILLALVSETGHVSRFRDMSFGGLHPEHPALYILASACTRAAGRTAPPKSGLCALYARR